MALFLNYRNAPTLKLTEDDGSKDNTPIYPINKDEIENGEAFLEADTNAIEESLDNVTEIESYDLHTENISYKNISETFINDTKSSTTYNNPKINANGTVTYDCVWFGNYWQSDTDGNETVDFNDLKQPIKWRVLSVSDDDLFLLSDKILDAKAYNVAYDESITWEKSTLRSWINGYDATSNSCGISYTSNNFSNNAFTTQELSAIKVSHLENYLDGGDDSDDKIFLLSALDISHTGYGFPAPNSNDYKSLCAKTTSFAQESGAFTYKKTNGGYGSQELDGNGNWWYREVGISAGDAMHVNYSGLDITHTFVNTTSVGVRPALHISASSSFISSAGSVCSDGTINESPSDITSISLIPNDVSIEIGEEEEISISTDTGYVPVDEVKISNSNDDIVNVVSDLENKKLKIKGIAM